MISILLPLLFARESDLGYDPTIRRYGSRNRIYYEYQVGTRFYRTQEALLARRLLGITGRVTRVWKAIEILGFGGSVAVGKAEVALKDVWLDAEAEGEDEIQQKIFSAINEDLACHNQRKNGSRLELLKGRNEEIYIKVKEEMESQAYKRYFLTIQQCVKANPTRSIPQGAIRPTRPIFHEDQSSQTCSYQLANADPTRSHGDPTHPSVNVTPAVRHTTHAPVDLGISQQAERMYKPMARHFLVTPDVGKALHNVTSIQGMFRALVHAHRGKSVLCCYSNLD